MKTIASGLLWSDVSPNDQPQGRDLLILCAGYEDRAHALLDRLPTDARAAVLLVHYVQGPEKDDGAHLRMRKALSLRGLAFKEVGYDFRKSKEFARCFAETLGKFDLGADSRIWVDVSGLTTYGICIVLEGCRRLQGFRPVTVMYVEARSYYPTKSEYLKYAKGADRGTLSLPPSLTAETSDVLILDEFSGYVLKSDPTCLMLFAGYQKHRSVAVIESVNPGKVVIVYGVPPNSGNRWRADMSKSVHEALLTERIRAEERVSTLDVDETVRLIESYYAMLCDDHNMCICSTCSKMQTVGVYLAWERYRDIQLAFPLPLQYLHKRSSKGAGDMHLYRLPFLPGLMSGASQGPPSGHL